MQTIMDAGLVPDDYWSKPEWYQSTPEERESFYVVKRALDLLKSGSKRVGIRVYRAVPKSVKEDFFRNGDWVSPSLDYAKLEGKQINGGYRIISGQATFNKLWWDGNSIAELGYDDGEGLVYKNTKNNRK
jgi:hypothetical protein